MLSPPLEAVYDPFLHCISPEKVAATLHVSLAEVARIADVHRNTLARAPASPKVQARLGEVMRILAEAADLLGGDVGKAGLWFCHQPLAGFDGRTAEEQLAAARERVLELVADHSSIYVSVRRALAAEGVELVDYAAIPEHHDALRGWQRCSACGGRR